MYARCESMEVIWESMNHEGDLVGGSVQVPGKASNLARFEMPLLLL